jgi:hypothetical protein
MGRRSRRQKMQGTAADTAAATIMRSAGAGGQGTARRYLATFPHKMF